MLGYDPEFINPSTVAPYSDAPQAKEYAWLVKVIGRAVQAGSLDQQIDSGKLTVWASDRKIRVPKRFAETVQRRQVTAVIGGPEREILLLRQEVGELRQQIAAPQPKSKRSYQITMLAAAIEGFGYRGKNSAAPAKIASAATRIGLSISAPVISNHLAEAVEDLDPDWSSTVDK